MNRSEKYKWKWIILKIKIKKNKNGNQEKEKWKLIQGTIKKKAESSGGYSGVHDISTQDGRLGAALDYMHDEMKKDESSDDEVLEFEDAKVEEVEDTLLAT